MEERLNSEVGELTTPAVVVEPRVLYDFTARDIKSLEKELERSLSEHFRRVWLQYTRLGSVCIIAFPPGTASQYEIFTESKLSKDRFNLETLKNIVLSKINPAP